MKIWEFSIKRPITIFMAIIAVLIFGAVSYTRLNLDMLPNMNMPMLMVNTNLMGASPSEIEETVTKNLEEVISTASNVKSVKSISKEGNSVVMVQFEDGTDMDFASLEIREKVDMIKGILPKDTMNPMIIKMDPSMMPIMNFGVSLKNELSEKISDFTENIVKKELQSIDGVASVNLSGAYNKTVKIQVDGDRLNSYGLNMQTLLSAIKSVDINYPIGNIIEGDYEVLVRTSSEITSLEDFSNISLKTNTGEIKKLSDISTIEYKNEKGEDFAKINGNDALILTIQKESMANTVEVTERVKKKLEQLKSENNNLEVIKIMDQGEVIEFMVDAVKRNAIIGAILAVIVLLLFLKDIRTTIIMGISIPISIVWTFVLVYFGGLTLNMISLGGIALGVGMLVDNSIVVIESIYRYKKLGYSNKEAASLGTKEVAQAIMASTLTSICVFLPIVFVEGMAADIFKEMALTVTFSLLSSLMVSFTLVPVLCSRLLKNTSLDKKNKVVEKLKVKYAKALEYSLKHKKKVIFSVCLFIAIGVVVLLNTKMEFFPTADQGIISIKVEVPKGIKGEFILETSKKVLEMVSEVEDVKTVSIVGNKKSSTIYVILEKDTKKKDKEKEREVREKIGNIPGAKLEVSSGGMQMTSGSPISISIKGEDFKVLEEISNDVIKNMKEIDGIENIKSSNSLKTDEIKLKINKEKAAKYGLNDILIAQSIGSYFKETKVMDSKIDSQNYEVYVSLKDKANLELASLEDITVTNMTGSSIPLMQICTLERGKGYSEISRNGSLREINIQAGLDGSKTLSEAKNEIQKSLQNYNIVNGYEIVYGGEIEQMEEAFSQLLLALVLAVILVYMVMAAQFESLINPFIIMFTVPVAFVSAIITLFMTNVTVSIPAMIGFIMLTGIIVNNGIVLIDFINKEREKGKELNEAIISAGKIRLQPILMTAFTTVIGLLPMALGFGEGNEIQLPLAMTVIGGLTVGTILTLIVVPVIYSIFDKILIKYKEKIKKK
ncbi:MAG: efflux RND transporter permease subunit [Clostridium sp.]|uniref:efflux RND transporter permease subunit n=1 Tax=Clostridium sp. TaxID=1506 RepID=UPI003EE5477F